MFWGYGSTAVSFGLIEVEGQGYSFAVGDDALISSGVVMRNFDMHSIVDLATGHRLNNPVNTVIEQHVWLGQDAYMLGCERIGYGSIIGARAFVKGVIPPKSIAAGMPARVLATNRSWGRSPGGMTAGEAALIARMDAC